MGVGAPDGAGLPVQQVAHGQLLTGALGMEVHQDDLLLDLCHIPVGNDKGVVGIAVQGEAAHQIQHAHIPEGGAEHADAPAGALGAEVGRAQNLPPLFQVGLQLRPGPGVVAQGDHVRPRPEDGVGLPGGDAHHVGVLAVDHGEIDIIILLEIFQSVLQKSQARFAAHIAHGQYPHAHPVASAVSNCFYFIIVPQIGSMVQCNLWR